mmetsp:Transcript_75149/g.207285  ORF Transcript_75149/g.207285 Transcript_75149/m.207285 type:complete len:417 (+) Transcript_75149:1096-2346(+)
MVTQPSFPLSTSRHCSRATPRESLTLGGPVASTTSSSSSLPTVLLVPISKLSVTEMLWMHMKRSRKTSSNSLKLISPFLSVSMNLKIASRWSGENARSSRPNRSGIFSKEAENAGSLMPLSLLLPPSCLKIDSLVTPGFCSCSLKASMSKSTLLATRKPAPLSTSSGAAVFDAFSISASTSPIMSLASASSFLATNFCSRSLAAFLDLANSTWMPDSLLCSFLSCSSCPEWPFTSFCLSARKARASSILACAARSRAASFSHISVAVSAERVSRSSVASGTAASAVFSTSASTARSFSLASSISAVRLRFSVSLLNWLSFWPAVLMRSVSFWNSSMVGLERPSAKRRTSKVLEATKVRASVSTFCTTSAAASELAMVATASLRGRTSIPFRKGNSASFTLSSEASTSSVFLVACFT